MKNIFIITLFSILVGCITPIYQTMPETKITVTVKDQNTKQPISGAKLVVFYRDLGGNEDAIEKGPFYTDDSGTAIIELERQKLWVWRPEGFFAGGYMRSFVVTAKGGSHHTIVERSPYDNLKTEYTIFLK